MFTVILFAPAVFPTETEDVVQQTKLRLHVIHRYQLVSFLCLFPHGAPSGRLSWRKGVKAKWAWLLDTRAPRSPTAAGATAGLPGAPGARRAGAAGGIGAGAGAGAGWSANPGTIA